MPKEIALKRARADARAGKRPSTQAGEFIRTEMDELKKGNPNVRSRQQAIAIGLSEARRAGIPAGIGKGGGDQKRRRRELAIGQGRARPSPTRSRGAKAAARTRAQRAA